MFMTDAMLPLMNNTNIVNSTAHKKLLTLYGGTPPTKEQIEGALYSAVSGTGIMQGTTRGQYNQALIHAFCLARGGVYRGYTMYPAITNVQQVGAKKIRFPLSERPEELVKVAVGPVTFFTMTIVAAAATLPTSNNIVYWLGIGTVGAPGSGADLELFNGEIDNLRGVKANDIILNFTGV